MIQSVLKMTFNSTIYIVLGAFFIAFSFIKSDADPWKLRVLSAGMLFFYIAIVLKRNSRPAKSFLGDVVFNYCVPTLIYGTILMRAWTERYALKEEAEKMWLNLFSSPEVN